MERQRAGKVLSPILGSLIALISGRHPFSFTASWHSHRTWRMVFVPERKTTQQGHPYQYWLKLKDILQERAKLLFQLLRGHDRPLSPLWRTELVSDILESKYGFFGLKKGFILAIPVFSMALTSYLSGLYLSDKQNLWKPIIIGGMVGTAVSLAPLAWIESLVPYLGLLFLAGISIGIILPPINSLITGATSTDRRGMITCLYGTVRFFGVAIGPPTFGLALEAGKGFLFLGSAVVALTAALVALVFISLPTADFSTR